MPASVIEFLKDHAELPDIKIVDVGANPLTAQKPPYQPLLDRGAASLVGFEPDPAPFAQLQQIKGPRETYLPLAVGDGATHQLRICAMSGMNSLLEPNFELLDLLHYHGRWGQVLRTIDVDTVRLDDLDAIAAIDYLKIDIQGGELMVFDHGKSKLKDCLVVHTEAMFVPMYRGQPLFSEQELSLRQHGLYVHKFFEVAGHVLKPFMVNNDGHAPLSQLFWADVIFVKDITHPERLTSEQLLKTAVILHEVYGSIDAAHLFLAAYDQRHETAIAPAYAGFVSGRRPRA